VCYIILSNGKRAIVDREDIDCVNQYSWHSNGASYAYARLPGNNRSITLHHMIAIRMGLNLTFKIDHKSRDTLDCRRSNLREATSSQNGANSTLRSDNTSGYRGVSWMESKQKYQANIQVRGRKINLGHYKDIIEAARAYNKAALCYFGVFANLNEVD
jgi:hypothetical protein